MVNWLDSHRGPFQLLVVRPWTKGRIKTEWLKGSVSSEDVEAEAQALLTDPRDKIILVNCWSLKDNQFVMSWRGTHAEDSDQES